MTDEQLASDKLLSFFRLAGAFVGSAVVTGKEVAEFSAGCGKKAVDICKASTDPVTKTYRRMVPKKEVIEEGSAEGNVDATPIQTAAVVPTGIETQQRAQPVVPDEKASAEETAGPGRPAVVTPEKRKPEHAEPALKAGSVPPAKAETKPSKTKAAQPQVSRAEKSAYRDVTSEEIETAGFAGATEKVLFRKALSDLAHRDAITRAHAARAIGAIRNTLSVRALAAHVFREDTAEGRKACINALGTLGMKEGLPVVEEALNDSSVSVRLAAVRGVYRLAGVEGASALTRMLADENAEVRRMAATCIGWSGQEHLAAELVPLLTDEALPVRLATVQAMDNLGSRQVVFALIERLNDPDKSIRNKAFDVLERITGKRMGEDCPTDKKGRQRLMVRWRQWWEEESER